MKTIRIIILSIISALAFSSCIKIYHPVENGSGTSFKIVDINVQQDKWAYSNIDNNNYFYATVSMPEITSNVFKGGVVKMYRIFDNGTSNAAQFEMPYENYVEGSYEEEVDGTTQTVWYNFCEKVDYKFNVGNITIFYQASDFDYEIDESFIPEGMDFRCVILY